MTPRAEIQNTIKKQRKSGRLRSETLSVKNVNKSDIDAMWSLYGRYYTDATHEQFTNDLHAKSHAIILRDSGDRSVQGFSTIHCYSCEVDRKKFYCIYSGDTIVDRAYWGQNALQKAFLRFIVLSKLSHPFSPVYWFLISKGYKTYLLLSRNFPIYWPRHDKPTPAWEKSVIDYLGQKKFGIDYKPETGLIQHETCPGRLRETVAPISDELKEKHADIRFFVEANPNHVEGDELCCLGLVSPAQWTFYLTRLTQKWLTRFAHQIGLKRSKNLLPESSGRR